VLTAIVTYVGAVVDPWERYTRKRLPNASHATLAFPYARGMSPAGAGLRVAKSCPVHVTPPSLLLALYIPPTSFLETTKIWFVLPGLIATAASV
jgi:hypothetical protein